jgi:glycogen debranching enzyme
VTGAWTLAGSPATPTGELVTLVEGATFCISDRRGDIEWDAPLGLFVRDSRVLSRWILLLDGEPLVPMSCQVAEPFAATFVARGRPRAGHADSTVLVVRHRAVGDGMRETITVRNLGQLAVSLELTLVVHADFADIFAVKEDRVEPTDDADVTVDDECLHFTATTHVLERGVSVCAEPAGTPVDRSLLWRLDLEARGAWTTRLEVTPSTGGHVLAPRHGNGEAAEMSRAFARLHEWRSRSTVVSCPEESVEETFMRSVEDLGALRIFDPEHPSRAVVAAGAPWFMALFGRDSLLTSWMLLPLDRHLALGTLQTLAERQGRRFDPTTEEQPGRILHEVRFGPQATLWLGGHNVYYGTVDATPLFVMLVGELRRWGADWEDVEPLLPNVDRALDWITQHGDRDGDGFVEYQRLSPDGLEHQGWKDSGNAVTDAEGNTVPTPIALAEVQGYAYAAFRARAALARESGDTARSRSWDDAAEGLRHRFNEAFWLPDRGWFAFGLDGDKRPIDSLTSNMGHCLWTGIIDEDKAEAVVDHLLSPAMFSGWGIRTLATTSCAYNPISYHNGSVWPHDNAIIAAGLARYGYRQEAARIATAQLEVAEHYGGRLPELFCGFDRAEFPEPVPYPAACSPQAWASAAPFLLLRAMLGLEPDVPAGVVQVAPAVPERFLPLAVENLMLGEERATILVSADGAELTGLGRSLRLVRRQPRS